MPTRPNILYLHSHDTGTWLSPYGFAVDTPRLQKLAFEGVTFRNAFTASPTCSPSRAALLTGQAAHSCGMFGLANRGWSLRQPTQHLAAFLQQNGYATALAGFQHVTDFSKPESLGYQRYLGNTRVAHSVAADYLRQPPEQPFFLDVGFFETHRWMHRPDWPFAENGATADGRYRHVPPPLPDVPAIRKDIADFAESAARLDAKIGIVLDALDSAGLAENTLVLYTTDHGPPFPGMKCNLTDAGLRVAMIARGPGGFAGGQEIESLVSHLDVYPTLCQLASIERPDWCQGRSLLPLTQSAADSPSVFAEINDHIDLEPQRCIRTSRWKYIRRYASPQRGMGNCDPSPSKDYLVSIGWANVPMPKEQLFDVLLDPTESANVIERPEHAEVLADLRRHLDEWMRQTSDPLLTGELPAPSDFRQPFTM